MRVKIRLIACALALLCLAGCASRPAAKPQDSELLVVGFSQLGSESSWRLANTASMTAALSREKGYELLLENAKQKQDNQLAAVRNFILQGVDLIVIAPVAETGWESVLQEARRSSGSGRSWSVAAAGRTRSASSTCRGPTVPPRS